MSLSILVTGATGFIGKHLIQSLQGCSYDLHATVRKIPNHSQGDIHYSLIKDLNSQIDWSTALAGIDIVIHLAGRAHILKDQASNPFQEFQKINTAATASLVTQAIASGVKHFIFISSIGAMTTLSDDRLTENSPCMPDTLYGRSKFNAEQGLIQLATGSPMTWTILRPTLVYGPGNPGNMERLIKLIDRRIPLPLGAIHNQRSFLYVGNLVNAIICCINHPGAKNQTFIISDGHDLSTTELIKQLAQVLNKNQLLLPIPTSILRLIGKFTGQTQTIDRLVGSLSVDSSKIQAHLEWHPPYSIAQGLENTCKWYRESHNNTYPANKN